MAPPDDQAEAPVADLSVWRVRWLIAALFTAVSLVATASAEPPKKPKPPTAAELQATLTTQLVAEAETIGKALATVTAKLTEADATRAKHLTAAYRLVRDERVADSDRMTVARRRAAARLLLQRDREERTLLADEVRHLEVAAARVARDQAGLANVPLPPLLLRPARGAIARHFGALVHERSKATLTRRGIDIDVEEHDTAVAAADGVVRYAGPIRGLDNGAIIDHGTCITVIGKLGEVTVPVGAKVARGDRIGRAARQRLYFEVRVKLGPGGLPIDPEPLLVADVRK